jgi:catechol 2,3-dioxygenase-like lactoylglutathione lyase family enzyme
MVLDLDEAVRLFCDVLGCQLLSRNNAGTVAGEQAVVDLVSITITLLQAHSSGSGVVLLDRSPRLAAVTFASPTADGVSKFAERAMEAGLIVTVERNISVVLPPEAIEGALGSRTAIIVDGPPVRIDSESDRQTADSPARGEVP